METIELINPITKKVKKVPKKKYDKIMENIEKHFKKAKIGF